MSIIALLLLLAMLVLALVVDVAALVGWLRRRTSTNLRRRSMVRWKWHRSK